MAAEHVELTRSAEPLQETLIAGALREAGIPFLTRSVGSMRVVLGGGLNPFAITAFDVTEDRLGEAKDVLCAHGIVCDVSARLLRRTFDEVVLPLLGSPAPNFDRLLYLLEINNKETVRSLFDFTAIQPGGVRLLEDLFFSMAATAAGGPAFHALTRVLLKHGGAAFGLKALEAVQTGLQATRISILEVLNEDPAVLGVGGVHVGDVLAPPGAALPKVEILTLALRDEDAEVRDAAAEALFFATKGQTYDYDPDAPAEEREAAVERFLAACTRPPPIQRG